jgi:competence protein ComEC
MRTFICGLSAGVLWLQMQATLPVLNLASIVLVLSLGILALAANAYAQYMVGRAVAARFNLLGRQRFFMTLGLSLLMFAAGAGLGVGYATWRAETRLATALVRAEEGVDISVLGRVASLATATPRGVRFEFLVEKVLPNSLNQTQNNISLLPERISLSWYKSFPRKGQEAVPPPTLIPGEQWQITVRLRRPHGNANPHGFDFEAYALERNIGATGYVRQAATNARITADIDLNQSALWLYIDRARHHIRERMQQALADKPYGAVLVALAIGEQSAIPDAQWKTFWRTGVGHLVSISGLHITMVASLVYWLMFRLWARVPQLVARVPAQRAAILFGLFIAFAYTLIAGFSVPTQRTFFMLCAMAVAMWSGKPSSFSGALLGALFFVIIIDPWAVTAAGFWLSFGAVAAILYVTAYRVGREHGVLGAARAQVAVTAGLLPLTLALFQEVSIISPIANAFAIPAISLIVVPLTLIGAILPFDFLLHFAHWLLSLVMLPLDYLASLPNAVWQSHAPVLWTTVLAVLGTALLLAPRGVPARWWGLALIAPMLWLTPKGPKAGELWVTLLDVGQGLAAVVRTENHVLVYDTGPSFGPDADAGSRIIVPYLRGEGLRKLDALVISHADEDHSGGARAIVDARSPEWVLTSVNKNVPDKELPEVMKPVPYAINAREWLRCDNTDAWKWDEVVFEILHPLATDYEAERVKTNNIGCVLKITAPGGSILMTADIEKPVEAALIARAANDLVADVLVVPHHGSKTSSTEAFIDAVSPKLAIIPVGYRNRFRHPHPDVLARYVERNIPIMRSDYAGAITLKFTHDAKGMPSVSKYRDSYRRYWTNLPEANASAVE